MSSIQQDYWQAISGLVAELKRCDQCGITTASIAMAYICIDALANLARPIEKDKVTRSDFKEWIENYLIADPSQPYQYRGKDVYAARCAFLHTYGAKAELHDEDTDTIKFTYHDGGMHLYSDKIEPHLVLISTKSFVNDVVIAASKFVQACQSDRPLKERVESRLPEVLQVVPLHSLPSSRNLGIFKGKLNVPEDFDAALPGDVALQFQNESIEPSSGNR